MREQNLIAGDGGNDTIYGNGENDTLFGGGGNDILDGGWGWDTADYGDAVSGMTMLAFQFSDFTLNGMALECDPGRQWRLGRRLRSRGLPRHRLRGHPEDPLGNLHLLYGMAGDDLLVGGNGANYLAGGDGDDIIRCGDGIDT